MVSKAGGIIIAVLVLAAVGAVVGWIVYVQLRARRLGLPPPKISAYLPWGNSGNLYGPPHPATGGVVGWFNDQLRKFKNRGNRTAAGAYEEPLQGAPGRRGFGPLDPDEAWDSRVGQEADQYGYYEETELGPAPAGGSRSKNLPTGYEEDDEPRGRRPGQPGPNPFDDDAETSLRGVSPRPMDSGGPGGKQAAHLEHDNDTSERRSIFREDV